MNKMFNTLVILFLAIALITPASAVISKPEKVHWNPFDFKNNGQPFDSIWNAITDLQNQIANMSEGLQGPVGPQGETGPVGPQGLVGPQGETGTCSCAITEDMYNTLLTRIATLEANMPTIEVCDGKDNDIDGLIDEGFNLQTDEENCGTCNTVCEADQICNLGTCTIYESICTSEEVATIAQYLTLCSAQPDLCFVTLTFDTNLNTECKNLANALFECAITSTCLSEVESSESFACLHEQCAETTFAVFGTTLTPEGFPCDDDNFCTINEIWLNGVCTPQSAMSCNDDNTCTTDSCNSGTQSCSNIIIENCTTVIDEDSDGYVSTEDCNDYNPEINPGAPEMCNAKDDDCDGVVDEGFNIGNTCGINTCIGGIYECSMYESESACSTMPGGSDDKSMPEVCDSLDNDCDGETDEGSDICELGLTCDSGMCRESN